MASTQTQRSPGGSKAAAISNHIVRTMNEYTGRGPTKARTHIDDDVVTVVLQDTLTQGERSLVDNGLEDLVLSMRRAFQGTMRHALIAGVEEILRRKVESFMSDNHIDPDVAVEVFLLAPAGTVPHGNDADRVAKTAREAMAGAEFGPAARAEATDHER